MKKRALCSGILLIAALLCACGKNAADVQETNSPTENTAAEQFVPEGGSESPEEGLTVLVYINDYDGQTLAFDEVEWIEFPGERAEELELSDPGSGFLVYNETENIEELPVAPSCIYTVLDWTNNYEAVKITSEELASLLDERENTSVPYALTVQENEITSVTEWYIP